MRFDIRLVLLSILDTNEDMLLHSAPGVRHGFVNPALEVKTGV